MVIAAMKLKDAYSFKRVIKRCPWQDSYDQPRLHIKKQRHHFANKGPTSQGYGFPVVIYGCESWTIKHAEC